MQSRAVVREGGSGVLWERKKEQRELRLGVLPLTGFLCVLLVCPYAVYQRRCEKSRSAECLRRRYSMFLDPAWEVGGAEGGIRASCANLGSSLGII